MMLGLTTSAFASIPEVTTPIKENTQDIQIISTEQNYEEIIQEILLCMYQQGMFKEIISVLFPEEVKKL